MYRHVKRGLDLILSFAGLLVLLPVGFVVALVIKWESAGPVFYRGVRAGLDGRPFRIFKFRTMVQNADRIGGPSTSAEDTRVTRSGRFLRRYKLDEFPQLLNVLKGEMSLVGPRPEVLQYTAMFTDEERAILNVLPGITDWASIWNSDESVLLAGSSDPERTYLEKIRPTKIRLQLEYVNKQSLWTDLRILLETIRVLLPGQRPMQAVRTRYEGDGE